MLDSIFRRSSVKATQAELTTAQQAETVAHEAWDAAVRRYQADASDDSFRAIADAQAAHRAAKERLSHAESARTKAGEDEEEKARLERVKRYESFCKQIDPTARANASRAAARKLRDHVEAIGPLLLAIRAVDHETRRMHAEARSLAVAAGLNPSEVGEQAPLERTVLHEIRNELRSTRRAEWPAEWKPVADTLMEIAKAITS